MTDPIAKFIDWWGEALSDTPLKQKNAICVSTVDETGCPNARFVDLKAVDEGGFTFCTYYESDKGKEIAKNPRTAITVWWDHVGYQVRVVGRASKISDQEAEEHWSGRSVEAQLTTAASHQSKVLKSEYELQLAVEAARQKNIGKTVSRPKSWGGYRVIPDRVEFLTFRDDRLHRRELFTRKKRAWEIRLLQP